MCPSFLVPGLLQNSRRPGQRTEVYLPESPCLLLFEQSGKRWSVGIGLIWIPVPSFSTLDSLLHWFSVSSAVGMTPTLWNGRLLKQMCFARGILPLSPEHSALSACICTYWLIACVYWVLSVTHLCNPSSAFHTVGSQQCFLLDWYSQGKQWLSSVLSEQKAAPGTHSCLLKPRGFLAGVFDSWPLI